MPKLFGRSLPIALTALATTTLGGCYYGDVYGSSYAGGDCTTRYGADYYDSDGYAYDDGYGYDCYDGADYSGGFALWSGTSFSAPHFAGRIARQMVGKIDPSHDDRSAAIDRAWEAVTALTQMARPTD